MTPIKTLQCIKALCRKQKGSIIPLLTLRRLSKSFGVISSGTEHVHLVKLTIKIWIVKPNINHEWFLMKYPKEQKKLFHKQKMSNLLESQAFSEHVHFGGRRASTGSFRHLEQSSHWAHCSCLLKDSVIEH
jgi:hypothetical protein